MIKSMTGYGHGSYADEGLGIEIETKSINHRYCDISIRMPKELMYLEHKIRKIIQKRFFRGHFDVWIKVEWPAQNRKKFKIDYLLADEYLKELSNLKQQLGLIGEIDIEIFLRNSQMFLNLEEDRTFVDISSQLQAALNNALDSLSSMRNQEGRTICEEIQGILKELTEIIAQIEKVSPQLVTRYK